MKGIQILRAVTMGIGLAMASFSADAATVTVATIANLKTYATSADTVIVQDYYAPSSSNMNKRGRGGGTFRWVPSSQCPSTADEGRFIASTVSGMTTTGMWERMFNGEIPNVRMWGAVGDATINPSTGAVSGTDDTAAFQRMFNTIGTGNNNYNHVEVSLGWYKVTDRIIIPDGVIVTGESAQDGATKIIMSENSNENIFVTKGAAAMLVGGLTFPGNGDFVNSASATAYMSHGLTIENIYFHFAGDLATAGQTNAAILVGSPGDTMVI